MSTFWRVSLLVAGIGLAIVSIVRASQYDPHVYPTTGPFFEGWYARLTDTDNGRSLGVLFGRVLPDQDLMIHHTTLDMLVENFVTEPTSYIGLLRSDGADSPMVVAEAFPNDADIVVTVGNAGMPVTENPDLTTPAHFQWVAQPYGYFNVTPRSTVFSFTIDGVTFSGNLSAPILWDSTGRGPENWLTSLPFLPIHWFVYSLGSSGTYSWSNSSTQPDRDLSGKAHAHQEKNWGEGFPSAWVWTQAYDRSANASFAGSFGVVSPLGAVDIPAHLFGYRNFERGLSLDFRPDNSLTKLQLSPCDGTATITVRSVRHVVEIAARSPAGTLNRCLRGPVESGFVPNLVETYEATIRVIIHERGIIRDRLIEDRTFYHAAFEFGRDYLCPNNPCHYRPKGVA